MYFPKIKKTKEQLEFMINAITLEYGEQRHDGLVVLICENFGLDTQDVSDSLIAYKSQLIEDFELESKKIQFLNI